MDEARSVLCQSGGVAGDNGPQDARLAKCFVRRRNAPFRKRHPRPPATSLRSGPPPSDATSDLPSVDQVGRTFLPAGSL